MNINFFENLVYGVFGGPLLFSIIMLAMFVWYAVKFDFNKHVFTLFVLLYGLMFSNLIGTWVLGITLVAVFLIYYKEIIHIFSDR